MNQLDLKPETALSHKKINGMMLLCYENERPLRGMLGDLEWRFGGPFSKLLKEQILSGRRGEMVYFPLLWNRETFHFLIVGAGPLDHESSRLNDAKELFEAGNQKLKSLQLKEMGISAQDWNLKKMNVEDPNLWILN